MDNVIIILMTIAMVTKTIVLSRLETVLTQQLLTTTDKSTPITTKEKLKIIPITSSTIAPTRNSITTTDDNCKEMMISDLVKTRNNWLTTTLIKTPTTTFNIIIANIIFATLVNDLKMIYVTIIEWNHVIEAYG